MSTAREKPHTSIYTGDYELSQIIDAAPDSVRPFGSRVLIRDDHEEPAGLIVRPTAAPGALGEGDTKRIGIVVAVGLGDAFTERWSEIDRRPIRKPLGPCEECGGSGWVNATKLLETGHRPCPACGGDGLKRIPMECKPGDRVFYDRRREAEFYFAGERYSLVYEEQSVLAILTPSETNAA